MIRFYTRNVGRPRVVPVRPADRPEDSVRARAHAEERLEVALEETFPASDPIAVSRID